jgi:hypothetical protein
VSLPFPQSEAIIRGYERDPRQEREEIGVLVEPIVMSVNNIDTVFFAEQIAVWQAIWVASGRALQLDNSYGQPMVPFLERAVVRADKKVVFEFIEIGLMQEIEQV